MMHVDPADAHLFRGEFTDVLDTGRPLVGVLFTNGNPAPFSNVTLACRAWDLVDGLEISLNLAADYDLWHSLAYKFDFRRVSEFPVFKRVHPDQSLRKYSIEQEELDYIISKMVTRYPYLLDLERKERWAMNFEMTY
jgi:hypothetical protein